MPTTWLIEPARAVADAARRAARRRQDRLTKPPGALGRLEEVAVTLAGLQGRERPSVDRIRIVIFAADHGVYAEGVAPFPQAVTVEMIRNFAAGGAAINVLARGLDAELEVVNLGTVGDPGPLPNVVDARIGPGTANIAKEAAMTESDRDVALVRGREAAERAGEGGCELLVGGEMGIANTTAAAALGCALTGVPADEMVGPGTGLDPDGVRRKGRVVRRALDRHASTLGSPLHALGSVGGFEIAALTGCLIRSAQLGIPVLVDGFIATAAALAAVRINPSARDWMLFGHQSGEPGHARLLAALDGNALLNLGMRLGEGSGAAAAAHLIRVATALHAGMATFESADVSRS